MSAQLELRKKKRVFLLPPSTEESAEVPTIQGPLGVWNFPLLNALLQFMYATRVRAAPSQAYFPRTASRRVEYIRNKEGRIIEKYEEIEVE